MPFQWVHDLRIARQLRVNILGIRSPKGICSGRRADNDFFLWRNRRFLLFKFADFSSQKWKELVFLQHQPASFCNGIDVFLP